MVVSSAAADAEHALARLVGGPRDGPRRDVEQHARPYSSQERRRALLRHHRAHRRRERRGPVRVTRPNRCFNVLRAAGGEFRRRRLARHRVSRHRAHALPRPRLHLGLHRQAHLALRHLTVRLHARLDHVQGVGRRRGEAAGKAARGELRKKRLLVNLAVRFVFAEPRVSSERDLRALVRGEVYRGERDVHRERRRVRAVQRADALRLNRAPHAVPHAQIRRVNHLQSLLHRVHRGLHRVSDNRRARARERVRQRRVFPFRVPAEQTLHVLVRREVHGVRGAGADTNGGDAAVQTGDALRLDDVVGGDSRG
mmetsp:Transcript_13892/g.58426  ORF Transcript_13892/g.58426 Transcript_13892/m.58426 type:complete len:311 (-) Transcript_13892:570-1502(-)